MLVGAWVGGGDCGSDVSSSRAGRLCRLPLTGDRGPSECLVAAVSMECLPEKRTGFLSECRLCRGFSLMAMCSWLAVAPSTGEMGTSSSGRICSCCPMVDLLPCEQRLIVIQGDGGYGYQRWDARDCAGVGITAVTKITTTAAATESKILGWFALVQRSHWIEVMNSGKQWKRKLVLSDVRVAYAKSRTRRDDVHPFHILLHGSPRRRAW